MKLKYRGSDIESNWSVRSDGDEFNTPHLKHDLPRICRGQRKEDAMRASKSKSWSRIEDKRKETKQRSVEEYNPTFTNYKEIRITSFEVLKTGSEKGEREEGEQVKKNNRNMKEVKIEGLKEKRKGAWGGEEKFETFPFPNGVESTLVFYAEDQTKPTTNWLVGVGKKLS